MEQKANEEDPAAEAVPPASANAEKVPEHKPKKRRKKKKKPDPFDIPGVHRVVFSDMTQKMLGCVVGETVSSQDPWIYLDKALFMEHLQVNLDNSEFFPLQAEITNFPGDQFLIGYITDESKEYDEFYVCVTQEAIDSATVIMEKIKKEEDERLYHAINKGIREWTPQGTEGEVNDGIMRNSRPLMEVEVESKYPIFPNKVQFRTVNAEERQDGYMELKCTEDLVNIRRSRIDASVQVAPQFISAEAQTHCPYPTNSTTEYKYEIEGDPVKILEKCKPSIVKYANENMENVSDMLTVNGAINLYTDDYGGLCVDPASRKTKATAMEIVKEVMLFMEVKMCKGKMIADAVWHPMWTGTVAIAYIDHTPSTYFAGPKTEDTVMKAVYDANPVLIWSTKLALKPKLILEAPREVHKLSFCEFDENILVGGLNNGQIIIWDIRNKLNKVEELEVLTSAQQMYRAHMNSLMTWMKNIHNLALVRPTVLSNLRFSHSAPITGITWMNPHYDYNRVGKLTELPEDTGQTAMQFITCSRDGCILIWDLLKKPKAQAGGFKIRKLKRLNKKPSALLVDISPFKILHLNLMPLYRVNVAKGEDKVRLALISGCAANYCQVRYDEVNPVKGKKIFFTDRVMFKPVPIKDKEPQSQIHLGTMDGDYLQISWEGQDFESGEMVNAQNCLVMNIAKYHDGPVTSIQLCPETNAILTVGGKIFAIWREDFQEKPVLWRRSKYLYTAGEWNPFQPYILKNQLINGDVETWIVFRSSKTPATRLTYSSEYLSKSTIHPRKLKKNIYGAADKMGIFRLYSLYEDTDGGSVEKNIDTFNEFIDREIQRKREFVAWQTEWNKRYASWIQQREEEELEKARQEKERKEKEMQQLEEEAEVKVKVHIDFIQMLKDQRKREVEARIRKTIITKKQLDTKELEIRRVPLQKLEEENELKKKKQKKRLREGESMYHDTVAMLFPETVRVKPPPPPDPYAGGDLPDEMENCYRDYPQIAQEAEKYVDEHPYIYKFSWRDMVKAGRERKHVMEPPRNSHYLRHVHRKIQRELEEQAKNAPPPPPPKVVVVKKTEDDDDDFPLLSEGTATE